MDEFANNEFSATVSDSALGDRYDRKDSRQQGDGCKKRSDQKFYKLVQEVKLIMMWTTAGIKGLIMWSRLPGIK